MEFEKQRAALASQLLKLFHVFHVRLIEFVEVPWISTRLNNVPSSALSSLARQVAGRMLTSPLAERNGRDVSSMSL